MANLSDFLKVISSATTAELHEFNRIIEQRLTTSFKVGNRVQFDAGSRGGITKGKVAKVNRKSVKVIADNGLRWNVAPTFLTKI